MLVFVTFCESRHEYMTAGSRGWSATHCMLTVAVFSYQMLVYSFFFFSSRRRHTRSTRDWSSDVCSSDLVAEPALRPHRAPAQPREAVPRRCGVGECESLLRLRTPVDRDGAAAAVGDRGDRSEERRVGKECGGRGGAGG